ncbi:hypothetical protein EWM64_g2701, partial [Hericium alpestre]
PFKAKEYGGPSISDEIISEVYLDFTTRTREAESQRYMRTIRGVTLSTDATFKVAKKAMVTDSKHKQTKVLTGGLTTAINEHTETMFWEMSRSQANAQLTNMLKGYVRRCKIQGVPLPEIAVVDSCCHFCSTIVEAMPNTQVVLDTYHLMMRYLAAVVNGLKNPHWSAIPQDVINAILKVRAMKGQPAKYWSQAEQEERLKGMYEKWVKKGTVWSAAVQKWNRLLLQIERRHNKNTKLTDRPQLPNIESGKRFGIVSSEHVQSINGVVESEMKKVQASPPTKDEIDDLINLVDRIELEDPDEVEPHSTAILKQLHIDPALRFIPQTERHSCHAAIQPTPPSAISEDQIDPRLHTCAMAAQNPSLSEDLLVSDAGQGSQEVHDLTEDSEFNVPPGTPLVADKNDCSCPSAAASPLPQPIHAMASRVTPGSSSMPKQSKRKQLELESHAARAEADLSNSSAQRGPAAKQPCLPVQSKGPTSVSVITSNITVPDRGSKIIRSRIDAFLRLQRYAGHDAAQAPTIPGTSQSNTHESSSLPHCGGATLPSILIPPLNGLTCTERFFSVLTSVHPHSVEIKGNIEFYLFMDMRYKHKWASFAMTSRMWIDATAAYNDCLLTKNNAKGLPTIKKQPEALIEKLKIIEGMIKTRIKERDFVSIQTGTTEFWEKHCSVVALEKPNAKLRKMQCCSDGIKITDKQEMPLPWPQPSGIYKDGTHFNLVAFLDTVHDYYECIIVDGQHILDLPSDLINFALTLDARLVKNHPEDRILFCLWDGLEIDGPPLDDRIIVVAGHRFLIIDPLIFVMGTGITQLTAAAGMGGRWLAAVTGRMGSGLLPVGLVDMGMGAGMGGSVGTGAGAGVGAGAGAGVGAGVGADGVDGGVGRQGLPPSRGWVSSGV